MGERNEKMPSGSSHMMIYFILIRVVERAGCYRMLESCEGLKNLLRRRHRRGYEGLLSKVVQSWRGCIDAFDPLSSPTAFIAQV